MTVVENEPIVRGPANWLPVAHIGLEDDRTALCGAETLGIKAPNDGPVCEQCEAIWAGMSKRERGRFKNR